MLWLLLLLHSVAWNPDTHVCTSLLTQFAADSEAGCLSAYGLSLPHDEMISFRPLPAAGIKTED